MTYVKAYTSERARKYLATSQGRRRLLQLYLNPPPTAEELKAYTFQKLREDDQAAMAIKPSRAINKDGKPKA
ncbi:MAG: hypothetical protein QOH21_2461 [Acidobacteriota bacterium]|nr:hypothetical protein [Acidobacteriota bacterium]